MKVAGHPIFTLISGFSAGAFWGLVEASILHNHGSFPAGSGDPWLYVEGFLLYGVCGLLISFVVSRLIFRSSNIGISMSAVFFAFFYIVCFFQLRQQLFEKIPNSFLRIFILAIVPLGFLVFLFLKLKTSITKIPSRILFYLVIALFIISFGILIWHMPLFQMPVHRAAGKSSKIQPNIVVISLDTTRRDHLSLYGYLRKTTAEIDRFASSGIIFDNAFSVSSWTLPSHASLFTGKLPTVHGASWSHWWLGSSETTLAEILRSHGYATAGVVSGPFLLATLNIAQGFDYYDDQLDFLSGLRNFQLVRFLNKIFHFSFRWMNGQRDGKEVTDRAIRWLEHQDPSSRFFLFLNYFDPHDPYDPPAPYRELYGSGYTGAMNGYIRGLYSDRKTGERRLGGKNGRPLTAEDYQKLQDLYDGEIHFMDAQIGRLLDYFKNKNLLSRSVIIIIADHGESIGDHKLVDHGHTLYQEQIRVPLILAGPKIEGGKRVQALVRNIDLLPTLQEYLGLSSTDNIQGKSFLSYVHEDNSDGRKYVGEISDDPRTRVKQFRRDQKAVVNSDWKYLWSSNETKELYSLATDAHESSNIINSNQKIEIELHQFLFQYLKTLKSKIEHPDSKIDESTLESIKANNYFNQ